MARDATARLYDVDANSVVLDRKDREGRKEAPITFRAKKGRTVDLDKLHESIWATRLGDGTGMQLYRLEVTAVGELAVVDKKLFLKVPGTDKQFVLADHPDSKPGEGGKTPFQQLQAALERGDKQVSVTGRVDGWNGNFTQFLRTLPGQPRKILVKEFQIAKMAE